MSDEFSLSNHDATAIKSLTNEGTQDFYRAYEYILGPIERASALRNCSVHGEVKAPIGTSVGSCFLREHE